MTENEAIDNTLLELTLRRINTEDEELKKALEFGKKLYTNITSNANNIIPTKDYIEFVDMSIHAIEELEQYRELGTVEELRTMKEHGAFTGIELAQLAAMQMRLKDYQENGTIEEFKALKNKHIGKDNMVISSSDLMKILNSDSEELKEVRKGFEENRKAEYKHGYSDGYAKGIDDLVNGLLNWKSQDEEYKSFRDVCNEIAEQLKGGAV